MGRVYIPVKLSDTEEKDFRRKVFDIHDGEKGYLKMAATDAFLFWIKKL